jgi:hypothetical protein
VRKLRILWDWLLPGLIYLDPMVASAVGEALVENQASDAGVRRLALVSETPMRRRAAAQLVVASTGSSNIGPDSGRARL